MNGPKDLLLIRADASVAIGTGHIMRCLSLAQGWRRAGGGTLFALAESTPGLEERLRTDGFEFLRLNVPAGGAEDVAQTLALARVRNAAWVVADGYHFGADYQRAIKAAGLRLMLFDDNGHAGHYSADLVLNQNLHATPELYRNREPHTRLLLGTTYALLRPQFDAWRGWKREIPPVARKILVTLGGADPDNVTSKVIEALSGLDVEAKIIVGGSNPHRADLESKIQNPKSKISLVVDATNMPELMEWADMAVSAGGTTVWELAFLGVPNLVIVLARNQEEVAAGLENEGLGINLGWHGNLRVASLTARIRELLRDPARRASMSERGQRLVDGLGAERVVTRLRANGVTMRRARPDDARLLWEWANDPGVRRAAFNSAPIHWTEHQRWFDHKLSSVNSVIYLGEDEHGTPFGQVRFDWNDAGAAEVDVSIESGRRQRGLGGVLIRRAVDELFQHFPVRAVHACIRPENVASIRAFERADFRPTGAVQTHGTEAVSFTLKRVDDVFIQNTLLSCAVPPRD